MEVWGALVSQVVAQECPEEDEESGAAGFPGNHRKPKEVFDHYGLNTEGS